MIEACLHNKRESLSLSLSNSGLDLLSFRLQSTREFRERKERFFLDRETISLTRLSLFLLTALTQP